MAKSWGEKYCISPEKVSRVCIFFFFPLLVAASIATSIAASGCRFAKQNHSAVQYGQPDVESIGELKLVFHWSLFTGHCSLLTVHCSLFTAKPLPFCTTFQSVPDYSGNQ